MATAEQVKSLLKSFIERDEPRFYSIAMQIAATEAKQGHGRFAEELRTLIDEARSKGPFGALEPHPIPISRPKGELAGLLDVSYPKVRLSDMTLEAQTLKQLNRILREQRHLSKLKTHGLMPRRKVLLIGPPGTGKTLTASVLAGEIGVPLFVVRLDGLITKYMGETTLKLRLIFDAIEQTRGVYLFDEFDSIGTNRGFPHEVGEIRRVLNSFLMFLENDRSGGVIVAATNRPESLDIALYRRFDDVVEYKSPNRKLIVEFLRSRFALYPIDNAAIEQISVEAEGLNYHEIDRACEEGMKDMILQDHEKVDSGDVLRAIEEMKASRRK